MTDSGSRVVLGLPEAESGKKHDVFEAAVSKRELLHALERRIAEIEKRPVTFGDGMRAMKSSDSRGQAPWRLGVEPIDEALSQSRLDPHGLHDIAAETARLWPSAVGFSLAILSCLPRSAAGALLWCQTRRMAQDFGRLYGHGLAAFGLDPSRLVLVSAARETDVLWAMEEGLRTRGVAAVIGEVDGADFTATRRLALAAMEGHVPALLLRSPRKAGEASAALTRWRIGAYPGSADPWDARAPLHPRWRIELVKCRGGRPGAWTVEWSYATHRFSLAAGLADRAVQSGGPAQDDRPLRSHTG
jgi:protein ImuA